MQKLSNVTKKPCNSPKEHRTLVHHQADCLVVFPLVRLV